MILRVEQGKGHKDRNAVLPPLLLLERLRIWWPYAKRRGQVIDGGWVFPGCDPICSPFACPRSFGYCAWRPRSWRRAPEIQARVGPNPDGGPRSPASAIAARGPQWSKSKCNRERLLVAGPRRPARPVSGAEFR